MMSEHVLHTEKIGNRIYKFYSRYDEASGETKCFIEREILDDMELFESIQDVPQAKIDVQASGDRQLVAPFNGDCTIPTEGRLECLREKCYDERMEN